MKSAYSFSVLFNIEPCVTDMNREKYEKNDKILHRDETHIDDVFTDVYWEKIGINLGCNRKNKESLKRTNFSDVKSRQFQNQFQSKGFFQMSKDDIGIDKQIIKSLADTVEALISLGWPANFIFMFDEVWEIINLMRTDLKTIGEGNDFIGDIYAWCVDPKTKQKGWGPHRDRMGTGPESFKGKTPKLSTTWLALTDATPKNSCLYVIPATSDKLYFSNDDPTLNPLTEAFKDVDNYQTITCLSCEAGGANHFSHRLIHWGSSGIPDEETKPRIALSWVIGDKSFEKPCFDLINLPFPSINLRLGLICGQLINYSGQTNIKKGLRDYYFRIFKKVEGLFESEYRDKVFFMYFMRPPPLKLNLSKRLKEENEMKQKKKINIDDLEMPTEQDNKLVNGIFDMFKNEGEIDSSDSE